MHVTFPLQLIAVPVEKPFKQSCNKCARVLNLMKLKQVL